MAMYGGIAMAFRLGLEYHGGEMRPGGFVPRGVNLRTEALRLIQRAITPASALLIQ